MNNANIYRWSFLCAGILAIILVPYFLFGAQIEAWTEAMLRSAEHQSGWVALVLSSLLAVDILVPVPSSLVSTAAGFLLGFVPGTVASWIGMTVSCIAGYYLGAKLGCPVANQVVGSVELGRLQAMHHRFGDWVIVVSRPVPVLAEASVLFAGISHMPLYRFLLLSTLSNLGISVVYATVGAFSATSSSFLLAFAASILVPLAGMMVMSRLEKSAG